MVVRAGGCRGRGCEVGVGSVGVLVVVGAVGSLSVGRAWLVGFVA